jgi:HD superfamily phosphodiesterase
MNVLRWRKQKLKQRIKTYLINESLIDFEECDINYQIKVQDKTIKHLQQDILRLEFLMIQLKGYNKNLSEILKKERNDNSNKR